MIGPNERSRLCVIAAAGTVNESPDDARVSSPSSYEAPDEMPLSKGEGHEPQHPESREPSVAIRAPEGGTARCAAIRMDGAYTRLCQMLFANSRTTARDLARPVVEREGRDKGMTGRVSMRPFRPASASGDVRCCNPAREGPDKFSLSQATYLQPSCEHGTMSPTTSEGIRGRGT